MTVPALSQNAAGVSAERGSVLVFFALLVPVLLLLFTFVVDVGDWFVHRRHLQMQADAAALAGGARFGDCFSPDPAIAAAANTTIENAATAYAGAGGSTYNAQVGGGSSRITVLFNSKTFAAGGSSADDTETNPPCQTPSLMLDVKETERDVPYILGSLVDWVTPGSATVVPAINARARVELKTATDVKGSLPLAVPDVNPRYVTATFVNENAGGALLAGPFPLTKGAAAAGLSYWNGTGSVTIPADTKVGVRIGLGGQSGACAAADGTGGNGYVCYDYSDTTAGLVAIDGVGSGGTTDAPEPRVWATTNCASTGSPFFSANDVVSPATTCGVSVYAVMQVGSGVVDPTKKKTFTATLNGDTHALSWSSGDGYWSTGYAFSVPPELGPLDVSLTWQSTGKGSKAKTYADIQRVYSAAADDSGPVEALSLSSPTATAGAPYALSAGTHTISVSVGLAGNLRLSAANETVMLRLTGGSRTSAVACDGTGAKTFSDSIENGCQTPYQVNPAGYCPDPEPPVGPADCVPTETGEMAGPTLSGMDARFSACPSVNWPTFDPSDPRIVKLMVTDFSALGGSGNTDVPVTDFAAFYVTGWTGSKCPSDPPPVAVKKGAIWGHFIKYVVPDPFSGGKQTCDPLALAPCVPVLVK